MERFLTKKSAIWIDTYNSIDETGNVTKLEISEILLQLEKHLKATGNPSRI